MEKEDELLAYLSTLGFTGEKLGTDIRNNIKSGPFSFRVLHSKKYDGDTMNYELYFGKTHQFDAYRLEKYKATFVGDIAIEHVKKSGIDTAMLEEQMKRIDWQSYSGKPQGSKLSSEMSEVIAQLDKLSSLGDQQLQDIKNKLMFKYWPEESFGSELWFLRENYSSSRDFSVNEYGVCNADLAYYIVSDRLGNLYEDLSRLRLEDVIKTDLYVDLSDKLSRDPQDFELRYSINTDDGYYELLIPVKKEDGWHRVEQYHLEMTPHPEISHGIFNSVDSKELERLMKEINWTEDREIFTFHKSSEPTSNPKVEDVEEKMFRLALDPDGAHIADQLQTKYWPGVTFFEDVIRDSAWEKFDAIPKRQQEFPIGVPAKEAMNLLAGRAILNVHPHLSAPQDSSEWIRFDLSKKESNGEYPIIRIDGMNIQAVDEYLALLPVRTQDFYPLRASLLRGDIGPVTFSNEVKVLLEVNPEQKTLNIFSLGMKPIPFNFRFDPDWKPRQQQRLDTIRKQQEPKQKHNHSKLAKARKNIPKKGRGI